MIVLIALAAAPDPPPRPAPPAKATVRVLHAASASRKEWERATPAHRREILMREPRGTVTRLRLIEHE